jgi:hypothetical protein
MESGISANTKEGSLSDDSTATSEVSTPRTGLFSVHVTEDGVWSSEVAHREIMGDIKHALSSAFSGRAVHVTTRATC